MEHKREGVKEIFLDAAGGAADDPIGEWGLPLDAFASGEPACIANALGIIARARGMKQVAEAAGSAGRCSARRCPLMAIRGSAR